MSSQTLPLSHVHTQKLRQLYLRRQSLEKAITALEQLAATRDRRASVITIDQLRSLSASSN